MFVSRGVPVFFSRGGAVLAGRFGVPARPARAGPRWCSPPASAAAAAGVSSERPRLASPGPPPFFFRAPVPFRVQVTQIVVRLPTPRSTRGQHRSAWGSARPLGARRGRAPRHRALRAALAPRRRLGEAALRVTALSARLSHRIAAPTVVSFCALTPRPVVRRAARPSADRHRSPSGRTSADPGNDHRAGSVWLGHSGTFPTPGARGVRNFSGPFRAGLRAARPRCTPSLGRAGWHALRFGARPSSSERAARASLHLYDGGDTFFYFGPPFRAKVPSPRLSLPDTGPDGPESIVPPRSRGHGPGPPTLRSQVGGGGTNLSENFVPVRLRGFCPEPPALLWQAGGRGQNFQRHVFT